jgi:predicted nuclease of restriction endonuclease-like (RecB) superfamily
MTIQPSFLTDIRSIIHQQRSVAVSTVNHQRLIMYWMIGRRIFEEEQNGSDRADYGIYLIKYLASKLMKEFGTGFSARQLERYRQFYRKFPIATALRTQLGWTHYKLLLPVEDLDKAEFYLNEASKNHWSTRQLERQINSQLFERLLLSNNKEKVLAVARGETLPEDPKEIIKDPMMLEFLGIKPHEQLYESNLETLLINHLQDFIFELGNGFAFMARQKRIHLDGDDFFIDLLFYNRLLQCFVIFELKTHKLTHQDIGQLQMYVNYFDRYEKQEFENPTVGVLLCADKNDTVVKTTLPEDNKTILTSRYQLLLPDENTLVSHLKSTLAQYENEESQSKN